MEKWIYIGIFLDESSKNRLVRNFDIPENWKWYGDHVTLCFNDGSELSKIAAEINKGYVGAERYIKVTGIGISENAIALKVQLPTGVVCTNKVAHITLGAKTKPVDSNAIEIWHNTDEFTLHGEIHMKLYIIGSVCPNSLLFILGLKVERLYKKISSLSSSNKFFINLNLMLYR